MSIAEGSNSELKLIVLDQNAISNLALQPNKEWSEILELLRYGVSREKILCPTASETIAETSHLPRTDRKKIEEISEELSRGYYTKFFYDLIAQEILATVTDRGMTAMLRQLKFEDPEFFSVFSVSETQRITTFLKPIC